MPILNFTTKIAAEKTAMEIQQKLIKAHASAVLSEYEKGILSHICFKVQTKHGEMSFRLPANIDGVFRALERNQVPRALRTREQAARVAWRIIKDWVEAQLAIIEADMVTLPQVFLPYMQLSAKETVYERFQSQGMLALEYKGDAV